MNERISRLRSLTTQTPPSVSSERALLLTQFMQQEDVQHLPIPIQRAKAFQHLLAHQTITIAADELIVGDIEGATGSQNDSEETTKSFWNNKILYGILILVIILIGILIKKLREKRKK